jgi:uncharacterized protein YbaR (Trm112 family)
MDKKLLAILCCPVTHRELSLARPELLREINAHIGKGALVNRDGEVLTRPLGEALVTDDGKLLYPVDDGIPVLLEGESVGLEQLKGP